MTVVCGFPINGLNEIRPFTDQELETSADMLNVIPFDSSGRLRGSVRPGVQRWCPDQVTGSNRIQSIASVSATYVKPMIDSQCCLIPTSTVGIQIVYEVGSPVAVSAAGTFLAACFGDDGHFYVLTDDSSAIKLHKVATDGTVLITTTIMTVTTPALPSHVVGFCADSGVVYVNYLYIPNSSNQGIMRFSTLSLSNIDETVTSGVGPGIWFTFIAGSSCRGLLTHPAGLTGVSLLRSGMDVFQGVLATWCVWDPAAAGANGYAVALLNTADADVLSIINVYGSVADPTAAFNGADAKLYDLRWSDAGDVIACWGNATESAIYTFNTEDENRVGIVCNTSVKTADWSSKDQAVIVNGNTAIAGLSNCNIAKLVHSPNRFLDEDFPNDAARGIGIAGFKMLAGTSGAAYNFIRATSNGGFWGSVIEAGVDTVRLFDRDFAAVMSQAYAGSAVASLKGSAGVKLNSGYTSNGTARYDKVLAISNGSVDVIDQVGSTTVTNGASALSSSSIIYSAPYGVLVFFADGENTKYYDATTNSMLDWDSNNQRGSLVPKDVNEGFKYIEVWNGRILIFGFDEDESNYYFSRRGQPFDWQLQPGSTGAAISGRISNAGLFPGKLHAAIPFNENILLMGGEDTIMQMSGDPATTGTLELVSSGVGIAPGRAWCIDNTGGVYFYGYPGGVYRLGLNSSPVRISTTAVDRQMYQVDPSTAIIRMAWDESRQGVWIFIKDATSTYKKQWFYDIRNESWFPIAFPSDSLIPSAVEVVDLSTDSTKAIMLGGHGGYVYTLEDGQNDESTVIEAYYTIGPWASETPGMQMFLNSIRVAMSRDSRSEVTVRTGMSAEESILNGQVRLRRSCGPGLTSMSPRLRADGFSIRVSRDGSFPLTTEKIVVETIDKRRL